MKLGVLFPQTEIGADPAAIRDFAQAIEALGYHHLSTYEHVLGARPDERGAEWVGPYTHEHMFHEPFVLFGYLAGATRRLEFGTSVLNLPQRQTVLVAKQAAELDVLTGGRVRLGVGVGWNSIEYEAMGADFEARGARVEEQVAVLRLLWTQELVTFEGRWHRISAAGLNPMPVQRPIPIWMAGESPAVIRRVGRLADGWYPGAGIMTPYKKHPPQPENWLQSALAQMRQAARGAGRDPASIGINGWVSFGVRRTPEEWRQAVQKWQAAGATHLTVNTMRADFTSLQAHIDALRRFKQAVVEVDS